MFGVFVDEVLAVPIVPFENSGIEVSNNILALTSPPANPSVQYSTFPEHLDLQEEM